MAVWLRNAVEDYHAHLRATRKSKSTRVALKSNLTRFLSSLDDRNPWTTQVTPLDVTAFFYGSDGGDWPGLIAGRNGDGEIMPRTWNSYRAYFTMFLKYLAIKGHITLTPAQLMEGVQLWTPDQAQKVWLDLDQLTKVANAQTSTMTKALVLAGMQYGHRSTEITNVKIGDLQLDRGTIRFRRLKKRGDKLPVAEWELNIQIATAIAGWLEDYASAPKVSPHPSEPMTVAELLEHKDWYLFPGVQTVCTRRDPVTRYFDQSSRVRFLRPDRPHTAPARYIHLGLSVGLGWSDDEIRGSGMHVLRRSAAMELWRKTKDIRQVQEFLGHTDVKVTLAYLNDNEEIQKLNELHRSGEFMNMPGLDLAPSGMVATLEYLRATPADDEATVVPFARPSDEPEPVEVEAASVASLGAYRARRASARHL